jgi:hypothetical protein
VKGQCVPLLANFIAEVRRLPDVRAPGVGPTTIRWVSDPMRLTFKAANDELAERGHSTETDKDLEKRFPPMLRSS